MTKKKVETGLAIKDEMTAIGKLFKEVDFSGLNAAIESLGDCSSNLQPEEKKMAIDIVKEWESNVVARLNCNISDLSNIINFLSTTNRYCNISEELLYQLAITAEAEKLFNSYIKARDNYNEARDYNELEAPVYDIDMTDAERKIQQAEYEKQLTTIRIEKSRLQRSEDLAFNVLKSAITSSASIKALKKEIKDNMKKIEKLKVQCSEKSQLAKLNITISNAGTRESLKALIEFSKNI